VAHTPRRTGARLALACSCSLAGAALSGPPALAAGAAGPTGSRLDTAIVKAPFKRTVERRARFAFSSTGAGSKFECRLDADRFEDCRSPATFARLESKRHVLRVRAVGAGGRVDRTPAVYRWRVMGRHDSEHDVEGSDLPPPPGSPAEQFEQQCSLHPAICA
jgi:hypothetical protein